MVMMRAALRACLQASAKAPAVWVCAFTVDLGISVSSGFQHSRFLSSFSRSFILCRRTGVLQQQKRYSNVGRDPNSRDEVKPVLKAPSGEGADTHDDFKPVQKNPGGSVHEAIEKDIKDNPVMVYMKGIPEAPQCGFSAMVVRILKHYEVPFSSRNVLEDQELREGVKSFSKWPTIPQVYIQGEFVGGCDIVTNMHRSGELKEKLKAVKPDLA